MRQKTGGAALSLLGWWTTDDEEDAKETIRVIIIKEKQTKTENNHNNKTRKVKSARTQPSQAPKESKKKTRTKEKKNKITNPAAGSKSIQRRDVHMCITREKKEKKPNIMSYNCSYDWKRRGRWGRGMRIWISVSTWWDVRYVCVSVCMLPLYEGRVPCSLSKSFLRFTWLHFHFSFFLRILGFEVLMVWRDTKINKLKHVSCVPIRFQ